MDFAAEEGKLNSSQGLLGLLPDATTPLTSQPITTSHSIIMKQRSTGHQYMRAHAHRNADNGISTTSSESRCDSPDTQSSSGRSHMLDMSESTNTSNSVERQSTVLGPRVPFSGSVFGLQHSDGGGINRNLNLSEQKMNPPPPLPTTMTTTTPHHYEQTSMNAIPPQQTTNYGVHTVVFGAAANEPMGESVNGDDYVLVHSGRPRGGSGSGIGSGMMIHETQHHSKRQQYYNNNTIRHHQNQNYKNYYTSSQPPLQGQTNQNERQYRNQNFTHVSYQQQQQFMNMNSISSSLSSQNDPEHVQNVHMPVSCQHPKMAPLESAARRADAMAALADSQHPDSPGVGGDQTSALAGALSLYVKALKLLHSAGKMAQELQEELQLHPFESSEQNMLLNAVSSLKFFLKNRFVDVRNRAKVVRSLIKVPAGGLIDTNFSESAESLVWRAALNKCKHAAAQELLGKANRSRDDYFEALVLLETLLLGDEIVAKDRKVVQEFGDALTQRLTALNQNSSQMKEDEVKRINQLVEKQDVKMLEKNAAKENLSSSKVTDTKENLSSSKVADTKENLSSSKVADTKEKVVEKVPKSESEVAGGDTVLSSTTMTASVPALAEEKFLQKQDSDSESETIAL